VRACGHAPRRTRAERGSEGRRGSRAASGPPSAVPGVSALARLLLARGTGGALLGDVLPVARTIDVDKGRVHREPIEDRRGERRVAEVAAPITERDVAGDRGREAAMPAVDQVVEGVGGGRLVVALLDLAETYVVDDEKLGAGPSLESARIRSVGDGGVEIVEEVDAARVTHADPLPAGLEGEGFEDVALAG